MTEESLMSQPADDTNSTTDGLWRWLLGGLAAGGVILGLLVAAYAVGYHRGHDHSVRPATNAAAPTTPTTTTTASPPVSAGLGPVTVTPALVARGKTLYTADSCSGCHSLSGAAGAGPSFKGLAGSTTTLDNRQTVTADDAYLERSISDPDAQIVKGYSAGLMAPAIAGFDLAHNADDLRALVAFIKSQK
jgi:mono/diheme cytochrome c family protein